MEAYGFLSTANPPKEMIKITDTVIKEAYI